MILLDEIYQPTGIAKWSNINFILLVDFISDIIQLFLTNKQWIWTRINSDPITTNEATKHTS